jgi:hypothetical protein
VPVLARVRKPKEDRVKNCISFSIPVLTPLPPPHPQPQINFDSQKKGDILNDCLMTVDGTDLCVPQKGTVTKGNAFASHKYAGRSALCYELGMSILGGGSGVDPGSLPCG